MSPVCSFTPRALTPRQAAARAHFFAGSPAARSAGPPSPVSLLGSPRGGGGAALAASPLRPAGQPLGRPASADAVLVTAAPGDLSSLLDSPEAPGVAAGGGGQQATESPLRPPPGLPPIVAIPPAVAEPAGQGGQAAPLELEPAPPEAAVPAARNEMAHTAWGAAAEDLRGCAGGRQMADLEPLQAPSAAAPCFSLPAPYSHLAVLCTLCICCA